MQVLTWHCDLPYEHKDHHSVVDIKKDEVFNRVLVVCPGKNDA